MGYKQLDYRKRCQIYGLCRSGYNQSEIAKEVGVHKSTISREFKRNITFVRTSLGYWDYKPDYAQYYTTERHRNKPKARKFIKPVEDFVTEKIQEDWSPDQISGYAKRHNIFNISHERIYRFILANKQTGANLHKHLRHQHKKYRKRYGSPKRIGSIKNRRFIDDRPTVVDQKNRIGDWEIDTIIGKNHRQAIISIVERVSKKTILSKVKSKTAKSVYESVLESMTPIKDKVLTITADNGSEFARHEKISADLETEFYFAHPYSSWERGLNENTNGLVRQYFKKGSGFESIDNSQILDIMNKLNNRPRKNLGYQTPNEVFIGLIIRETNL